MSLSLPLKDPNGRQYSSDSFNRFGDDLCELLLSYLSIKNKYRFECVSHQWRRLIYNKIIHFDDHILWPKNTFDLIYNEHSGHRLVTDNQMKIILQKCPNVKTIKLYVNSKTVSSLSLLSDNCPRLKSIELEVNPNVLSKRLTESGEAIGSKVETLMFGTPMKRTLINNFIDKNIFYWCPNLKRLNLNGFLKWEKLIDNQLVPTLNTLSDIGVDSDRISAFVQFVDKYENTLKDIVIWFYGNSIKDLFQQLCRLKNLECLDLRIILYPNEILTFDLTQMITILKACCPNLSKISFGSDSIELSHSFETLKDITYLDIDCFEMSEEFFANLSNLIPGLKELKFNSRIIYSNEDLIHLSRLKYSKRLFLRSPQNIIHPIDDSSVIQLLDNCKELKELKLDFPSNITSVTIDKLKEVAIKRPKERISFLFDSSADNSQDFRNLLTELPNNLSIIILNDSEHFNRVELRNNVCPSIYDHCLACLGCLAYPFLRCCYLDKSDLD